MNGTGWGLARGLLLTELCTPVSHAAVTSHLQQALTEKLARDKCSLFSVSHVLTLLILPRPFQVILVTILHGDMEAQRHQVTWSGWSRW